MGPGGFRRLQNGCDPTWSGLVGSIPTRSRQPASLVPLPPAAVTSVDSTRRFGHCRPWRRTVVLVAAAVLLGASGAAAQSADSARAAVRPAGDSAAPRPATGRGQPRPARDSLSPPVSPGRAFFLSLALPGLGQSRLNRPTAGGVYFMTEAIWLAMLVKAGHDLRVAKAHARDVIVDRYQIDPTTGAPIIVDGKYVPKDTLRSRYADPVGQSQTGDQQQRSRVKARRLHFEDWIAMLAFNHLFSAADAFVSSQLWDLPAQVEVRALPRGTGIGLSIPFR